MHENAAEHRWLSSRLEPAKLLIVAVVPVVIVLTLSLLAGSQRDGPLLFPALPLRSGTVCARCSYTTALDGRACCRVLLPPVLDHKERLFLSVVHDPPPPPLRSRKVVF